MNRSGSRFSFVWALASAALRMAQDRQSPALSLRAGGKASSLMSVPWLKGPQKRAAPGRVIAAPNTQAFSGGVRDTTGKTAEYSVSVQFVLTQRYSHQAVQSQEDECPVCKSDRYLNPKLRLLVSSCYHKMCVFLISEGIDHESY